MCMGRAQELYVKKSLDGDVHRVPGFPSDNERCGWCREAPTEACAGLVVLDIRYAPNSLLDCVVACASAQITLERTGKVGKLCLVERGGRDYHAGGAKAALKALGIEKGLLHRVQFAVLGEPLNCRHLLALRSEGRIEATVHRRAVHEDAASATVAGIAALFDAEPAEVAEEGAQALSGAWVLRE